MRQSSENSFCRNTLYQSVTDRIICELEAGRVPWVQPWDGANCDLGMPRNAVTNRSYSGINVLILWDAVIVRGFAAQKWLTFRQAVAAGGHVRSGECGTTICYADRFIPRDERQRASEAGDEPAAIPFLKRFTVFNVEQCENLPETAAVAPQSLQEADIVSAADAVVAATGADIRTGGGEAFYHPVKDYIQVPPRGTFFDPINYYRTLFHELGHWTGHGSRLSRDLAHRHGSEGYAREELVAELASAFLCASQSITPTVRHADYIGAWLTILQSDVRAIFQAASMATKAADFVLTLSAQGGPG